MDPWYRVVTLRKEVREDRSFSPDEFAITQQVVAGTTRAAAVVSLPRCQVEMTDWDQQWQERITKVVRRVARDLIANDESEIS